MFTKDIAERLASGEPCPCGKPEPGVTSDSPPKKSPENPETKEPQFPPERHASPLEKFQLCFWWLVSAHSQSG